jgi:hypothetical protein
MLPTVQSPKVPEEHEDDRAVPPSVTEAMHRSVGVRQLQFGEHIEVHEPSLRRDVD